MMPLYDDAGATVAFEIALDESSGPVSPRFQYTLRVRICSDDGVVRAEKSERSGVPKTTTESRGELTKDAALALWRVLDENDALARGADLVGDKRSNAGVSFNTLVVRVGDKRAQIDYLLTALKDPAHAALAAIVAAVKRTATALLDDT
jgi:hypothetical protein